MGTGYKLSVERLAKRVEWEGGVLEAIQYGIKGADIANPELAEAWHELEQLWSQMEPALVDLNRCLRQGSARSAARPKRVQSPSALQLAVGSSL